MLSLSFCLCVVKAATVGYECQGKRDSQQKASQVFSDSVLGF